MRRFSDSISVNCKFIWYCDWQAEVWFSNCLFVAQQNILFPSHRFYLHFLPSNKFILNSIHSSTGHSFFVPCIQSLFIKFDVLPVCTFVCSLSHPSHWFIFIFIFFFHLVFLLHSTTGPLLLCNFSFNFSFCSFRWNVHWMANGLIVYKENLPILNYKLI